jgi:hypothetical protein
MNYIIRLFQKEKKKPPLFAEAVSEGIKDMFREMGHQINIKVKEHTKR